jgi:hypothetical protein
MEDPSDFNNQFSSLNLDVNEESFNLATEFLFDDAFELRRI